MDFLRMVAQILKFLVLALLFSLNSCLLVGPDYKEPAKKVAEHWSLEDKSVREAPINNANWWEQFKDPTLSCLMKQGYHNNINLQAVAARVLKARAILAQSVGKLYPQKQDMTGNLIYQKIGGQDLQFVLPPSFTTAVLGASAAWEMDFWGKYRRQVLANNASFLSSYAAYDNALVSLTADIATTYINIRTTEELISVTKKNIAIQDIGLRIAEARYKEGETNLLD